MSEPIKGTDADTSTVAKEAVPNKPEPIDSDYVETDKDKVDFTKGGVEKFKFYPDNPENHRHKYKWTHKEPSKYYDPCEESRQASLNCILRNQDDKLVCQDFFDAYKECRKDFFNKKRKDRIEGRGGWGFW
ncbi:predicted protein [Scheffersomyces stipitis CBS 6054]|uniref:Cytochrome c oxidase-assembly factor COX23, mitochondrial n=1 Tax=Scheffersomyces stipitis (strain ATCC 58785 / CBS 6054 / NBRC 10063 / NRRL Y-11545) TaxID=322104 RepID=A3M0F5_PICST|nr:predicted protein [Scheffersomyces stipitis CBS 6054]ABN68515.2 predicted protein [Scheffersomyces stipitis CBS 6054]KAG2731065.1 hypothetical protein G9P44_006214 [Scheffersomyces stipitis]